MIYLTLGDPVCEQPGLALALVRAGADMIEFGIPTPNTNPAGEDVRDSFQRAAGMPGPAAFQRLAEMREQLPQTAVLALSYPATAKDLGWTRLLRSARQAGVDGLVLTDPSRPDDRAATSAAGLSCIPLLAGHAPPEQVRQLEADADQLTYRSLAARTGDRLELAEARSLAAQLAATASKPFLAGFGISAVTELRALAQHATGLVVGSQLLRVLAGAGSSDRIAAGQRAVSEWKAACRLRPGVST